MPFGSLCGAWIKWRTLNIHIDGPANEVHEFIRLICSHGGEVRAHLFCLSGRIEPHMRRAALAELRRSGIRMKQVAAAANVHDRDLRRWAAGQIPDTSVLSARIEAAIRKLTS